MNLLVKELTNQTFIGADKRSSLLDVIYPVSPGKYPVVIFLHGFKGFKDWGTFPFLTTQLAKNGFVVVRFNFSHNGGTITQPIDFPDLEAFSNNTITKELDDVKAVFGWLQSKQNSKRDRTNLDLISLIGHSRGGGVALLAASKFSWIKSVITITAVADFKKRLPNPKDLGEWKKEGVRFIKNGRTAQQMPVMYDYVKDILDNSKDLTIKTAVENLSIPQLIIHGSEDETVSLQEVNSLKDWNENAEIAIIDQANHTLDSTHPWNSEELPKSMKIALSHILKFLKA